MKWGLVIAIGLGIIFTIFQAYEYSHAAFGFSGNIYGQSVLPRRPWFPAMTALAAARICGVER